MHDTIFYTAIIVAIIAVAVGMAVIIVRRDGQGAGDLIKQLIIWIALVTLLPLTSYAGATLLYSRDHLKDLVTQENRAREEIYDTEDIGSRSKSRDQRDSLRKRIETEELLFNRTMFWVSAPIGFVTLVAGFMLRPVPVGTGLAFGGLCTLTNGCYSYWDDMHDILRFSSLLIVLVTLVVIGLVKYRRQPGAV